MTMFRMVASAMLVLVGKLLQQLVIPTTRAPVRLFRVPPTVMVTMFRKVASAMLVLVGELLQQLVLPTTRAPVRLFRVPRIAMAQIFLVVALAMPDTLVLLQPTRSPPITLRALASQ